MTTTPDKPDQPSATPAVSFDWSTFFKALPKEAWKTFERVVIAMFTTRATVPLGIIVWLIYIVKKLESHDLKDLLQAVITAQWFCVLGWVLFVLSVVVGIFFFRWRESIFQKELDRIQEVKNRVVKGQLELKFSKDQKP